MTTPAQALQVQVVHEADLEAPRQSGRRLRAYCPIHGGDHQRSLSIETAGEYAGYGWCHTCHARVFVPELNPDEAQRRERGHSRTFQPEARRVTPATLLRPVAVERDEPTPAPWQQEELRMLTGLHERMCVRLADLRVQAYLAARNIPPDIAAAFGIGYIPAEAKLTNGLEKWCERIMFPLGSPAGAGYAGRSLYAWRPGLDEGAHKMLLESTPVAPRRWEKTYPAGWLGYAHLGRSETIVLVEGPFDALALVAAGVPIVQLVALVGTAARVNWIPSNVQRVLLALDSDQGGQDATQRLMRDLFKQGLQVRLCPPPDDGLGKDWSERWRRAEWDGVMPVFEALDTLE